jgi:hypothetical protein
MAEPDIVRPVSDLYDQKMRGTSEALSSLSDLRPLARRPTIENDMAADSKEYSFGWNRRRCASAPIGRMGPVAVVMIRLLN